MNKRSIAALSISFVLLFATSSVTFSKTTPKKTFNTNPELATALLNATNTWFGSLTGVQKTKCMISYTDIQRTDWHFIPRPWRKGLALTEMTASQKKLALDLVRVAVSDNGYEKFHKIVVEQGFLRLTEDVNPPNCCGKYGTQCANAGGCPSVYSEGFYFFSVFGTPSATAQWRLSIEGHHFSVNYSFNKGQVTATPPTAFGATPAVMIAGNYPPIPKGTRNLAAEQDLGVELYVMLTPEQQKTARILPVAPRDLMNAGGLFPYATRPLGLSVKEMTEPQRLKLRTLIEIYAHSMPEIVAKERLESIEANGFDKIYFSFMGSPEKEQNKQYTIQGPEFLINFSNSQPDTQGNPANHIHTVWRNLKGDFNVANPQFPMLSR